MAGTDDLTPEPVEPREPNKPYCFGDRLLTTGLTMRQHFASLNMAAMLSNKSLSCNSLGYLTIKSIECADCLISELEETEREIEDVMNELNSLK